LLALTNNTLGVPEADRLRIARETGYASRGERVVSDNARSVAQGKVELLSYRGVRNDIFSRRDSLRQTSLPRHEMDGAAQAVGNCAKIAIRGSYLVSVHKRRFFNAMSGN
jgi:hypothetical protein